MRSLAGTVGEVLLLAAAIACVVVALSRQASRRLGGGVALAVLVAGALRWVATGPSWLVAVLFIVSGGFWLFDRGIPGNRPRPGWLRAWAVALIVIAAAVLVLTIAGRFVA